MKQKEGHLLGICLLSAACLLTAGCHPSGHLDDTEYRIETESAVSGQEESQTENPETRNGTAAETVDNMADMTQTQEDIYAPLENWISSLNEKEYKFCLWHKSEATGEILENGNAYEMGENDLLVLYKPEIISLTSMPLIDDFQYNVIEKDSYDIWEISFENTLGFSCSITSVSGNVTEFEFTLTQSSSSFVKVKEGCDYYICGPGNDIAAVGIMLPDGWEEGRTGEIHGDNLCEFLQIAVDRNMPGPRISFSSEESCSADDSQILLPLFGLDLNVLETREAAETQTPYGTAKIYYLKVEDSRGYNGMEYGEREIALLNNNGVHVIIMYDDMTMPCDGEYDAQLESLLPELFG